MEKTKNKISCHDGMYPILGTGGEMGRTNDFLTDKPSVLIGRKGTIDKPRYMDTPFWTVDTLFYTNVLPNTIPKWLFYKFGTINWYLYNEASGVPSLSSSTIYSIPINLPSLAEQSKIATFLSAIDDKICHVQTQIEKAELWKKGLLQKNVCLMNYIMTKTYYIDKFEQIIEIGTTFGYNWYRGHSKIVNELTPSVFSR
jgi:type I restriction enzyme S subunit